MPANTSRRRPTLPAVPEGLPDAATLRRDAAVLGVPLDVDQAERIIAFGTLLLRWNRAFNLVSRKDQERLYHRHLLDSLSVVRFLGSTLGSTPTRAREGRRCLDLGTGAGLPGIPLAVARPDLRFTLIDRNARKIRFVEHAIQLLELGSVEAVCADVESLRPDGGYDIVVSRAVAGLDEIWPLVRPLLRADGRILLMAYGQRVQRAQSGQGGPPPRGPAVEAPEAAPPPGLRIVALEMIHIPGLEQPHGLLVAEPLGTGPSDGIGN